MNKPKIKNSNLLENQLWENEKILWQSRPNASMWEYLQTKPLASLADSTAGKHSYKDGSELKINHFLIPTTLVVLALIYIFLILPTGITQWVNELPLFLVLLFICGGMFLAVIAGAFIVVGLDYALKYINGLLEKRYVVYAITNRRVCVALRWGWLYLTHLELSGITLEDSHYGTMLSWQHQKLERLQSIFPPFLGLNDFDVQQVLKCLAECRMSYKPSLIIEDKRQK